VYGLLINRLFSALSTKMNYAGIVRYTNNHVTFGNFPSNNYVLTKAPTSYVTIDYHDGDFGPVTGSLKIIVLDEIISTDRADNAIFADNGGFVSRGIFITPQEDFRNVYWTITQTDSKEYPIVWRQALHRFA
jgi:hypothetical protein